jgi:hypothetical protein
MMKLQDAVGLPWSVCFNFGATIYLTDEIGRNNFINRIVEIGRDVELLVFSHERRTQIGLEHSFLS